MCALKIHWCLCLTAYLHRCSQVQLTLPSRALHLTAADTAACAAAAGQWSTALVTLMAEYKRSIYFPECASHMHDHTKTSTESFDR